MQASEFIKFGLFSRSKFVKFIAIKHTEHSKTMRTRFRKGEKSSYPDWVSRFFSVCKTVRKYSVSSSVCYSVTQDRVAVASG